MPEGFKDSYACANRDHPKQEFEKEQLSMVCLGESQNVRHCEPRGGAWRGLMAVQVSNPLALSVLFHIWLSADWCHVNCDLGGGLTAEGAVTLPDPGPKQRELEYQFIKQRLFRRLLTEPVYNGWTTRFHWWNLFDDANVARRSRGWYQPERIAQFFHLLQCSNVPPVGCAAEKNLVCYNWLHCIDFLCTRPHATMLRLINNQDGNGHNRYDANFGSLQALDGGYLAWTPSSYVYHVCRSLASILKQYDNSLR